MTLVFGSSRIVVERYYLCVVEVIAQRDGLCGGIHHRIVVGKARGCGTVLLGSHHFSRREEDRSCWQRTG